MESHSLFIFRCFDVDRPLDSFPCHLAIQLAKNVPHNFPSLVAVVNKTP